MSDLICRRTMRRCATPGMCAPFQGCGDPRTDEIERLRALLRDMKNASDRDRERGYAGLRIDWEERIDAELAKGKQ